jgi:FkbM family methyltransferase
MIASTIKRFLKKLPIDFTQNQKYDRQAKEVIKIICHSKSCCIDVGSHDGEFIDLFLLHAPQGNHFAFEPLPDFYKNLKEKYPQLTHIYDIALSNHVGITNFKYVPANPAYSGILKREYLNKNEEVIEIQTKVDLLDHIVPENIKVDFIKIDVEGGELQVLEGAKNILIKNKPIVVFEHGLGASEYYATTPQKVYDLFDGLGFHISTMENWLKKKSAFTLIDFKAQYENKTNYYFIAYPKRD